MVANKNQMAVEFCEAQLSLLAQPWEQEWRGGLNTRMTGVAAVALRVMMACGRHIPYH
jgi:hypothetical protein